MAPEIMVAEVTLSTGKVIYLRSAKIADMETAMQIAGLKAKDNKLLAGLLSQKELLKSLLVKVGEKEVSAIEKETLDELFSVAEYHQALDAVSKITGMDNAVGELKIRNVSFGGK